jgi:hypothetical protein
MSTEGIVTEVNSKYGFYTVFWRGENCRWKNQPCGGISDHLLISKINVGDTVIISVTKRVQ